MKRRCLSIVLAGLLTVSTVCQSVYASEVGVEVQESSLLETEEQEAEESEADAGAEESSVQSVEESEEIVTSAEESLQGTAEEETTVVQPVTDSTEVEEEIEQENSVPAEESTVAESVSEDVAANGQVRTASVDSEESDFEYEVNEDGTITITGYTGTGGDVVIPDSIDGCAVTKIGYGAFEECNSLKNVIIPETVTEIGDSAFFCCKNLESVTIPEGVIVISWYAFAGCDSLISVTIPEGVTVIGYEAFWACDSLSSVTIPSSVTTMGDPELFGDAVFDYCQNLESITVDSMNQTYCSIDGVLLSKDGKTLLCYPDGKKDTNYAIPESVTEIVRSAFVANKNLNSITIPSSVTELYSSFSGCKGLENITVDHMNQTYCSIDGVLLSKDKETLMRYPEGKKDTNYIIPEGVTEISSGAFDTCSFLEDITVSEGVTVIGSYAFESCSNLKSITLSEGLREIGHHAFLYCTSLESITIPEGAAKIDYYAFSGCRNLKRIYIPASVTDLGYSLFANTNQKIMVIGERGSAIDTYVRETEETNLFFCEPEYSDYFYTIENDEVCIISYVGSDENVTILDEIEGYPVTSIGENAFYNNDVITTVKIPDGVVTIGGSAFAYCDNLANIEFPDTLVSIGNHAFIACESLTQVTFVNGLESIGGAAFHSCHNISNIEFPDTLTSIGDSAFYDCTSLTQVTFVNGLESIGDYAFYACNNLSNIEFPDTLTSIGDNAFYNCTSLIQVTFGNGLESIGGSAFGGCDSITSLKIPVSVSYVGDGAFAFCTNLQQIEVDSNNQFYCIENGALLTKDQKILIAYPCKREGTVYHIPDTVTGISTGAFAFCENLSQITMPENVTLISGWAFYGCSNLTDIEIPDSVTAIGGYAFAGSAIKSVILPAGATAGYGTFQGCTNLENVIVKEGVTYIGLNCFNGCISLKNISLPNTITNIGNGAFQNCKSLKNIEIPDSVTEMGTHVFQGCTSLESFDFPLNLSYLGYSMFVGCSALKSIELPLGVQSFWWGMFSGCSSLEHVIIPEGFTDITDGMFENCTSLKSIVIPQSVTCIEDNAFCGCSNLESILIQNNEVRISNRYEGTFDPNTTLYAAPGSTTETYAAEHGLNFEDSANYLTQPVISQISNDTSGVTITWEPVNRAEGYYIYRKSGSSDWETVGTVSDADTVSYVDNTVTSGNTYTYTVRAYVASGNFLSAYDETGKSITVIKSASGEIAVSVTGAGLDAQTTLVAEQNAAEIRDIVDSSIAMVKNYDLDTAVLYDIYLEKDGQRVQPDGEVTVAILVPDTMDSQLCRVMHIDDSGNMTDMNAVYEDGYMVFTTSHFSYYALIEEKAGVNISGTITSYGNTDDTVTVTLYSGEEAFGKVEITEGTYELTAIPTGTYTLKVEKTNHTTRTYEITVGSEDMTQDVKICLLGDVTGDGRVNTRDLNRIYAHVNGTDPLTGYEFACGDVTGTDSKVNTRDLNRLYAHINESNLLW